MLLKSDIKLLADAKQFAREPYTWPGGYPLALITADGGCLCADCTRKEWSLICTETFDNSNCGFRISGVDVNYENNELYCDHCNTKIQSAYGEE